MKFQTIFKALDLEKKIQSINYVIISSFENQTYKLNYLFLKY